eukprot:g3503.t1
MTTVWNPCCQCCGYPLVILPPDESFHQRFNELRAFVNNTSCVVEADGEFNGTGEHRESQEPDDDTQGNVANNSNVSATNSSGKSADGNVVVEILPSSQGNSASPSQTVTKSMEKGREVIGYGMDKRTMTVLQKFADFCIPLSLDPRDGQPLCAHCSARSEKDAERKLNEAKKEKQMFQDFLEQLTTELPSNGTTSTSETSDNSNSADEQTYTKNNESGLKELIAQQRKLDLEIRAEQEKSEKLQLASQKYWEETSAWELQLETYVQELRSLALQEKRIDEKLRRLKRTQVCNDAFHIWHNGSFGTINTFRLGRLPSHPVEFSEINAAWGQAAMLMATIERQQAGFRFQRFRVVPMGSYSKVAKIGDERNFHPLYWDGGWRGKSSYNRAMVAFLSCLKELGAYAMLQDRTIHMPYTIESHKIAGCSIQLGDWQKWTRACKAVLTNLKWLIAWSAKS